ncbi:MAG: 4-phosphoerythronate dehydrogenase [Bacteroidales bacterium]|nr:4-phosphoerythronate dehydrogenase [Bacteroidales bacterium]
MKIVADKAIPFIEGVFEPYAEIRYMDGGSISHNDILDADCLLIRTRTRCNAALLDGTSVKMISTATIGTDHIDLSYCSSQGIFVQNASGCNAGGVMDYVFSALYGVAARKSIDLSDATMGIVGVGNVGSKVEAMARRLGMEVLLCDPPRESREGSKQFCSLEYLLEHSDVVTMHVPLNVSTRKMCNEEFFGHMKFGSVFINAARGEILDDEALLAARGRLGGIILDTWNNEPDVNRDLLDIADIATPHIAGYSFQGKLSGTMMAVRAVARYFDISELFDFFPHQNAEGMDAVRVDVTNMSQGQITSIFQYNYPIFTDDFMFRMDPDKFDELRSGYRYRREFFID